MMKHLNPYRFYELAAKLHALFNGSTTRVVDMFAPITEAQALLDGWIKGETYLLETSRADAQRLLTKISNLFTKYYIDQTNKTLKTPTGEDRIDAHELALIYSHLEKFEHALAAELNFAPTYLASKRGIYSTYDLVEHAQRCFSDMLREHMPAPSLKEFNAAGRALAFGMGTAAGLHLLRAVEIVLKKYFETFSGTVVNKNERTYSIYLKKLAVLSEEEGVDFRPDKRLLQMLAQIKENYRNPLTNPESNISIDQATALFNLATAAMSLMTQQVIAHHEHRPPVEPDSIPEVSTDIEPTQKAEEALSEVAAAAGDTEVKTSGKSKKMAKAG